MRDSTPEISVFMPVYNGRRYLREAVESILAQTFRDFEFLIIDDGSSDGSLGILAEYAESDPRIRLISRENRGLVATLNEGLALARADLVARMDADDVSLPERLEKQHALMEARPEVVLCGAYYEYMDAKGRPLRKMDHFPTTHEGIEEQHLRGGTCVCHPASMYRRRVALAVGGYDTSITQYAEDYDLWLRMGERGQLANIPEILLRYRDHDLSASTTHHAHQVAAKQRILDRALLRRGIEAEVTVKPWRPMTRGEEYDAKVRHGWGAFMRGARWMTAEYALSAIAGMPWRWPAWKLLACAVGKRPRTTQGAL